MKILMRLSRNRADEKLFKTSSAGEFKSVEATDIKREEKESADFRVVVITLTDVRKVNVGSP
jgi:hypothetical protein